MVDWLEEDRNCMLELRETLVYCSTWAPDFPYPENYPPDQPPTLDSHLNEIRELIQCIETKIGHQEWMPRLLSKVKEGFDILRVQGRCRAGVAPLQEAEEILRLSKQRRKRGRKDEPDESE